MASATLLLGWCPDVRQLTRREAALLHGWRSGLEEDVANSLKDWGVSFEYETLVLEWTSPPKVHKYTPDFIITTASGKEIIIETKGRWMVADRMKMKCVVAQHPDRDIRMVFQNPNQRITKTSKTTYAAWCEKHLGIQWAARDVPLAWLEE